jgi:hypothetical protein
MYVVLLSFSFNATFFLKSSHFVSLLIRPPRCSSSVAAISDTSWTLQCWKHPHTYFSVFVIWFLPAVKCWNIEHIYTQYLITYCQNKYIKSIPLYYIILYLSILLHSTSALLYAYHKYRRKCNNFIFIVLFLFFPCTTCFGRNWPSSGVFSFT